MRTSQYFAAAAMTLLIGALVIPNGVLAMGLYQSGGGSVLVSVC